MRPPPSFWAFLIVLALGLGLPPGRPGLAEPGNSSKTAPGDWPQFHFDARNSGFNPFERILGPANVRSLRQSWSASTTSRFAPDPVVWGGKVYVAPTDGIVRAFDATTGELIWSTDTHSEIDAVAPALADGVLYVGTERGLLWALDADTGGLVWSERLGDAIFYPATVVGSVVYVSVLTHGGADEVTEALDAATGTALWARTLLAGDAPAVGNGMVYMAGALGATVYALDAATGDIVWTWSNGDEDEPHSSVVVDGGLVLFVMDGLHALNALTGRLVWARNTSSLATPAAAYGRVFMQTSSGQELLAWKDDGTPLWKVATPAAGLSSVAVANGVVYVGCDDETLRAYAAWDGGELWQSRQVGAHVGGSPAVASGMVYATTTDGGVRAFSLP